MIDPALKFVSTFGAAATSYAIAVDQAGNSYIGGTTEVIGFSTTPGAFEPTCPSGSNCAFVAKIDPSGSLVYCTYLAGSNANDTIYGIAVDSAGDAYVTGWALSSDFPVLNAFQPTLAGDADAFVAELNPTGSALIYSSYLGGASVTKFSNLGQVGTGIAVDASGSAYVIGHTNASDFPTTPGAFQTAFGGGTCGTATQPAPCDDAFITKVAPGGSSLVYSTFLGGSNYDLGYGIAVDPSGDAFVAGFTQSFDFPTSNAFQPSCAPIPSAPDICVNAFVTELNPGGSALVLSTYLGGAGSSFAQSVSLDPNGNIYVTGYTGSTNFPTVNALEPTFPSTYTVPRSGFVTEFAAGGATLVYSTYLGGSGADLACCVAVDGFGEAFATGITVSTDFPVANALQATNQGALEDAFITAFQAGGNGLVYSTYFGGPAGSSTAAFGIVVDAQGDAWVGGGSDATTFPAAASRPEAVHRYVSPRPQATGSSSAAFAGAIALDAARVHAAPVSLAFGSEVAGTTSAPETVTISNPGTAPLTFSAISASDSFSVPSGGSCSTSSPVAPGGNCTVDVAFAPTVGGSLTGTLTLTDNGIGSPHIVPLSGIGQDFTVSADKTSASVAAGGSATILFSVAPQGGFNHPLDLSCDDPAPHSTCTINPASVTPNRVSGATAVVSITTTAPSQVAPRMPNGLRPGPWLFGDQRSPLQLWLAALAMLAIVAAASRRRRPRVSGDPWIPAGACPVDSRVRGNDIGAGMTSNRHAPVFLTLVLALLLVLVWAACGGGGQPGTPVGTYTVTIKAADTQANLSHSTTLTLTVH